MQAVMESKCVYLPDMLGPFPGRDASDWDQSRFMRISKEVRMGGTLSITFVPLDSESCEYVTSKNKF